MTSPLQDVLLRSLPLNAGAWRSLIEQDFLIIYLNSPPLSCSQTFPIMSNVALSIVDVTSPHVSISLEYIIRSRIAGSKDMGTLNLFSYILADNRSTF